MDGVVVREPLAGRFGMGREGFGIGSGAKMQGEHAAKHHFGDALAEPSSWSRELGVGVDGS